MRNLRNIKRSILKFSEELQLTATAWDNGNDSLICAFGPSTTNSNILLRRFKLHGNEIQALPLIVSWDAPCPNPGLECDIIINLQYFPDTDCCCLVLAGGDIILVREKPLPEEEQIEIVGSVEDGISSARWSPDEDLLAICTQSQSFLVMSRHFEAVADVKFLPEDINASHHVSVGWGKAETQFKGKRAKALRDPTVPENVDEGHISSMDDKSTTISWRGDGEYVAVNAIESEKRRIIRVYTRDGILDSASEPVDFLEGALSWRPAGNLLAGVRRREDSADIVFFERNGLRHGQFNLRLTKDELVDWGSSIVLDWNVDSTVLAVVFKDRVQLWTMGNYHYYLKQTIQFNKGTQASGRLLWNPENALQCAFYKSGELRVLQYVFHVAKGSTAPPNDFGTVAVIDGAILKLTPLRHANIPPPMALHELRLTDEAIDVSVNSPNGLVAVLNRRSVDIYEYGTRKRIISDPKLTRTFLLPETWGTPYQIVLSDNMKLGLLTQNHDTGGQVHSIDITKANGHEVTPEPSSQGIDMAIISLAADTGRLYGEKSAGEIRPLDSEASSTSPFRLPLFCPWIEILESENSPTVFGLSLSGSLYANDRLLISNCTSFLLTPVHLIFTTSQHLLKFVHFTSVDDLEIPPDEPEKDERCRSIERGARLVSVTPSGYSLVLQMPRGNLETIFPRALVLAGIRRSIESKNYKAAFLACRNQRVDMNILHDHNPSQFMNTVDIFVDQVQKVEHIDLFLSQLREEDVSQTMYKETIKRSSTTNGFAPVSDQTTTYTVGRNNSKINRICDAFLRVFEMRPRTSLQNTITAHVCKSSPDLEGGLRIVSSLKVEGEEVSEQAAEHICFLADVNQLYDEALGIYDLDVAILIAQQSQKDPREYLPYIQSLQEMSALRRQFTIDNDLGRYSKALLHLHDLDDFEELKRYTEKHELYAAAVDLYKYQPERLNQLMRLNGDFLNSRNRFKEAGIAYEYLNDYASAYTAYRSANMWREALSCGSLLPLSKQDLIVLARDLAEGLVESKDLSSAARIHLEYLSDVEQAARLLCRAYQFADATRIVALYGQPEMLASVIDTGLIECFNSTTELLADCKAQIGAQVPRLRELRVKKEQEPLAFYAGDASAGAEGDIPDDISLAPTDASTSGGTFMTRYTGRTMGTLNTQTTRRTSKNKRREERKRARGKKGSVYEEEYLINSIGRLIERINSVNEDVGHLASGLLRRRMREQARAVEDTLIEVLGLCTTIVGEVYESRPKEESMAEDMEKLRGGDAVLWDAMETIQAPKVAPIIRGFDRLSLLG